MPTSRPPAYRRQREKHRSDRAFVVIAGRKIKLGVYGSPESKKRYADLIADLRPHSKEPEPTDSITPPTVSVIMAAYLRHAERYYRQRDGSPGREFELTRDVCRYVCRQDGSRFAKDFGPKRLKAVRQTMIDLGLARKYINKQIDRVRRMFRWAAGEELIPVSVPHALSMVDGLRKGRTDAKETQPIRPVAIEVVNATVEYLPAVVADMVHVQLLTGMRPTEVCIMRPCDIARDGAVWIYKPAFHKTDYKGHQRTIAIGPKAQTVLLRYLARAADAYLFQPRDSEAKRRTAMEARRKTPASCGNRRGTNRKANPKRQPGERYNRDSYRRAVERAAARAGVEHWTPHRLRHTTGTDVRKEFGLDACQAVLGHRGAKVSEIYAELDTAKAIEVARRIG